MTSPSPRSEAKPPPVYWTERADRWLDFPLGRFLDYGCGACHLLEKVHPRTDEAFGVDVDEDKIATGRSRHPDFNLETIGLDGRTPFPDEHFDTVAMLEVIEHVPNERATLEEIARILKPNGRLLLTTPHRGLLTFLDPGNIKFLAPGLHRFLHQRIMRNRSYYQQRFERGREKGMVGDITADQARPPWHRHYRAKQIVEYCPPELRMERHSVYFPGMRGLMLTRACLQVCTGGWARRLPFPFPGLERRLSLVESRLGDQLVMLLRKQADPTCVSSKGVEVL